MYADTIDAQLTEAWKSHDDIEVGHVESTPSSLCDAEDLEIGLAITLDEVDQTNVRAILAARLHSFADALERADSKYTHRLWRQTLTPRSA